MYFMYVDESGDTGRAAGSSPYFILSGMVIHEAYWFEINERITSMRDDLYNKYGFSQGDEIHSSNFLNRSRDNYSNLGKVDRLLMLKDVLKFEATLTKARVINVVIDKSNKSQGDDVFATAWNMIINRFENTIRHRNFPSPYPEKCQAPFDECGFIIVDQTDEVKLRKLVRSMRHSNNIPSMFYPGATVQSNLQHIVEDPMHKQSDLSPIIQLCDVNAYFLLQSISPCQSVKRHGAKNYFYFLDPILCKVASGKNPHGIVFA